MTVADYVDTSDADLEQPTPETLLAATLALDAAISQLVEPGLERLDRSRAEADEAVAAVEAEHARHTQQLRAAHALALHRKDPAGMRRALTRLIKHEQQAQARALTQAPLPSLLEQLLDAVASSSLAANGAAGSVHRIPIDPKAVELAAEIQRATHDQPGDTPAAQLRAWAAALIEENNPTALPDAAQWAERWVVRTREIVNPSTVAGIVTDPCPRCDNHWVWLPDDTGEIVRKPVLQVHHGRQTPTGEIIGGEIRCLWHSCGARWPQSHWKGVLGPMIHQRRQERADEEARRQERAG